MAFGLGDSIARLLGRPDDVGIFNVGLRTSGVANDLWPQEGDDVVFSYDFV